MGFLKGLLVLVLALSVALPAWSDDGNAKSAAPVIPKIEGLSCPFQMSEDQQKIQNQLSGLLKQISDQAGNNPDCSDVKSRIQGLSGQLQQLELSDAETNATASTGSGGSGSSSSSTPVPVDPSVRMNQELLAENMTFALGSRCTSALSDPTPLIYLSLFLASSFNPSATPAMTAGVDAAAVLLVELGRHIAQWLSKPPATERELNRDNTEQDFLNRLCILYLYDHEVDRSLAAQKNAKKVQQEEMEKAQVRLHEIDEQLATPAMCDECADEANGDLKGQLKSLQGTLHQITGDSALVDACGDVRDVFNRTSTSYRTIDKLASSCNFENPRSCDIEDDGKVTLSQADFCNSWCSLKKKDLVLNFDCDDASPAGKQELRSMENRARTVLQYVLAEGGAAKLDKSAVVQYEELVAQKKSLEQQLQAGSDEPPTNAVQNHESDPRLRDKVDVLTDQILGSDMQTYVKELSHRNKSELDQIRDDLKSAQRHLDDPRAVDVCPLTYEATGSLQSISDRLAHYKDLCTYLGNGAPALSFSDPSLSFWNQSSNLQTFCTNLKKREDSELSSDAKISLKAQIATIQKQRGCSSN